MKKNNLEEVTSYKYLRIDIHHNINWNYSIEKRIIGGVVSPRPSPIVNQVLKGIVIMFYRLVSQVLIRWRLMCLLGQGA
jgi:hypothetical protein